MKVKHLLFWATIPISFVIIMAIGIVGSTLEFGLVVVRWLMECMHSFEHWCFDYAKNNPDMEYLGDGIWGGKGPVDLEEQVMKNIIKDPNA